ncbi:MAG: metallophosphoesterase [Sphingomicrobium sp.]
MAIRAVLTLIRSLLGCALLALALPAVAQTPPRIVAVGDLHGDYTAWLDVARAAGMVDPAGHWSGGRATLVQLGDITDRGPDSLKIIRSVQQLAAEAPAAGGRVVVLLGNHEAMNLVGDLRYTTPGEFAAFADRQSVARRERVYAQTRRSLEVDARRRNPAILPSQVRAEWLARTPLGWVEHRAAWSPSGAIGQWAARNPAVLRIGDTLFAHGGISSEYAKLPLDEINRRAAAAMIAVDDRPGSILNDPLGPLWYRGLVMRDADAEAHRNHGPPDSAAELTEVLTALGAQRLVIAHTPSLTGIGVTSGGKLIRIDTGISRFYGGPLSWVEIVGAKVTPHTVKRSAP